MADDATTRTDSETVSGPDQARSEHPRHRMESRRETGGESGGSGRDGREARGGSQQDRDQGEPDDGIDRVSAFAGGGVAAGFFLTTLFLLGRLGAYEAISILEATLPTIRFLSSSAIAASSTVLALMLTLLGLTQRSDPSFRAQYFSRIRQIAGLCVTAMIVAVGLLVFMCVPIGESEELTRWYEVIYYVTFIIASGLGGLLVAIILLLRKAVLTVVQVTSPHLDHSHIVRDAE